MISINLPVWPVVHRAITVHLLKEICRKKLQQCFRIIHSNLLSQFPIQENISKSSTWEFKKKATLLCKLSFFKYADFVKIHTTKIRQIQEPIYGLFGNWGHHTPLFCLKILPKQPSKLNFLLGRQLATNSFGLGRPLYRSSCQLQNFKCHGDQNGRNWEGCYGNSFFRIVAFSVHCKTAHIFVYSSKHEQSNKRSGTRLKTESETGERR